MMAGWLPVHPTPQTASFSAFERVSRTERYIIETPGHTRARTLTHTLAHRLTNRNEKITGQHFSVTCGELSSIQLYHFILDGSLKKRF